MKGICGNYFLQGHSLSEKKTDGESMAVWDESWQGYKYAKKAQGLGWLGLT